MTKLESSFKNMVLVLSAISLIAALTLASVFSLTKEPIAASKTAKQQNAIREVLPQTFDHLAEPQVVDNGDESLTINRAYDKNNQYIGAAIESSSNNGFSGKIVVMVGFDVNANIVNYSVLEQKETPGLGTKMADWFKTPKGNQNILGKNAATANLTVSKDGGEVDAITAATISSRAFLFTIRNAYHVLSMNQQGDENQQVVGDTTNTVINN